MKFQAGPHKPDPEAKAAALKKRSESIGQYIEKLEALDYKIYLGALNGKDVTLTPDESSFIRNLLFNVMKFYPRSE